VVGAVGTLVLERVLEEEDRHAAFRTVGPNMFCSSVKVGVVVQPLGHGREEGEEIVDTLQAHRVGVHRVVLDESEPRHERGVGTLEDQRRAPVDLVDEGDIASRCLAGQVDLRRVVAGVPVAEEKRRAVLVRVLLIEGPVSLDGEVLGSVRYVSTAWNMSARATGSAPGPAAVCRRRRPPRPATRPGVLDA